MRGGQALRGSSEFHAWGDSNLYLRRHGDQLTLTVEHRAAPSIAAVPLQLEIAGDAVSLAAVDHGDPIATVAAGSPLTTEQKIEQFLHAAAAPLTVAELRKLCHTRNATLTTTLAALVAAGRIHKDAAGYAITR